jgi:hypothetical protein
MPADPLGRIRIGQGEGHGSQSTDGPTLGGVTRPVSCYARTCAQLDTSPGGSRLSDGLSSRSAVARLLPPGEAFEGR